MVVSLKLYDPLDPLARINYQRLGIGGVEVFQPRLEPYAVGHDHVGGLHPLDVAKRRLPVVRLDAAGNQHGHVGTVASNRPSGLVHGIERCQHNEALFGGRGGGRGLFGGRGGGRGLFGGRGGGRSGGSLVDAAGHVLLRLYARVEAARHRDYCDNGRCCDRYRYACHQHHATSQRPAGRRGIN